MNSYSRLLYFVKPYYTRMLFAVFCMIVAAAAYLVVPWLIKNVVAVSYTHLDVYKRQL